MVQTKLSLRSKAAHLVSDITTVLLNPISDEPSTPRGESPEFEVSVEPDTSSFAAFLASLLSSADSSDHSSVPSEQSPSSQISENPAKKGISGSSTNELEESFPQVHLPEISDSSLLISESLRSDLCGTWKHGISLSTLYRRSALCPGFCLLVVGDQKGAVFGGLLETPLNPSSKRKYQGTNNTFIFTTLSSPPSIFRPTGGGRFASYLDGDLLSGSSSTSETFGNSCLAHSEDFQIKEVELWGFVHASKYEEMLASCRAEDGEEICRW